MFTIKYRYYTLTQQPQGVEFICYDENESMHGPYDVISKGMENGYPTVQGIPEPGPNLPMTFGPFTPPSDSPHPEKHPRPTVWVMNEAGATVAKYDL